MKLPQARITRYFAYAASDPCGRPSLPTFDGVPPKRGDRCRGTFPLVPGDPAEREEDDRDP